MQAVSSVYRAAAEMARRAERLAFATAPHDLGAVRGAAGTAVSFVLLAVLAPAMLLDPFVHAEAHAALTGDAQTLHARTLHDGHWLEWLWAEQAGPWPASGAMLALIGLWCIAAGSLGQAIFAGDPRPWPAILAAVAIAAAPPFAALAERAPEALPMLGLIALWAVAVPLLPLSWAQALLVPLVPAALMAGDGAALAVFAVLLAGGRGGGDGTALARSFAIFVLAAAFGVAAIFLLNSGAHGVFGLEPDLAAGANPAVDPASALDNLDRFDAWVAGVAPGAFGPLPAVTLGLGTAGVAMLYLGRSQRGDRLFGGLALVLLILFAQTVQSGLPMPRRGLLCLWILVVAALAWAARDAPRARVGDACLVGLAAIAVLGLWSWAGTAAERAPFQRGSAALAVEIRAAMEDRGPRPTVPDDAGGRETLLLREAPARVPLSAEPPVARVVIAGSPASLDGAAVLTRYDALSLRLSRLLGREVVHCPALHPACDALGAEIATMPERPETGWIVRRPDGTVVARLPDGVFVPAPPR